MYALKWLILFVALTLMLGCGRGPKVYPVSGKVMFKSGQPVANAVVEFRFATSTGIGQNARGKTSPDGTFRLTTFQENDGAILGKHEAIVVWSPKPNEVDEERKRIFSPIDLKYRDYATSGLRFDVEAKSNEFTITLDSPMKR